MGSFKNKNIKQNKMNLVTHSDIRLFYAPRLPKQARQSINPDSEVRQENRQDKENVKMIRWKRSNEAEKNKSPG